MLYIPKEYLPQKANLDVPKSDTWCLTICHLIVGEGTHTYQCSMNTQALQPPSPCVTRGDMEVDPLWIGTSLVNTWHGSMELMSCNDCWLCSAF